MNTRIAVGFSMTGDQLDIPTVTNKLGIMPTKSWLKGDVKGSQWISRGILKYKDKKAPPTHQTSYWRISTQDEESLDVDIQFTKIYAQLKDKIEALVELRETYQLEYTIFIVVYMSQGQAPAFGLSLSSIDFIHSIGATLDVDLYCL